MKERIYIFRRILIGRLQSILFYLCRIFPIQKNKIVFTTIEGTTGYACNPKYVAEELLRRGGWRLVWLVNDETKAFPDGISRVQNTLLCRAYALSTAAVWVDNSRKQLEVRKRKGQLYIQTWHAKLGFKPTCMDRGASFSRIAYFVSKHDSELIDYVLSNSDWYDRTLPTGMLYAGAVLRTGSPRCDILVRGRERARQALRARFRLDVGDSVLLYAPTFRGGSQGAADRVLGREDHAPDMVRLKDALEKRFGGVWRIALRLHPQLTARHIHAGKKAPFLIDVSQADDMYEILAGCDAFLTDYSSAAFDAAVMEIPVLLYADDCADYEKERGKLLWDLHALPFPLAQTDEELAQRVQDFDETTYRKGLHELFRQTGMVEDGRASGRVADVIASWCEKMG